MASSNVVFVGIKGSVVALDRATGTQIWSTSLKGADLVNVVLCGGDLFAAARGEMFCLDPSTGHIRWHNPLKGYGYGLMTVAVLGGTDNQAVVIRKHQRDQEAAAAAAAASSS